MMRWKQSWRYFARSYFTMSLLLIFTPPIQLFTTIRYGLCHFGKKIGF